MASLPSNDTALFEDEAWFTAAEIADMRLPGLPGEKRSVNRRAREERWASRQRGDGQLLIRKRTGRGGGAEYHVSLLPGEARLELARRGLIKERPQSVEDDSSARWEWFDAQKDSVKAEAQARLDVIITVETLQRAGSTQTAAVAAAAQQHGRGKSTILGWIKDVRGLERSDRLPALAPQYKGGGSKADIDEELWHIFKTDILRASAPTLTSAYDRVAAIAQEKGLSIPAERTFRRRAKAEIPPEVWLMRREGVEALERSVPANRRSVAELHALEWVNIDGHRFDVFVTPPPMHRSKKPIRPMLVAIQDVYSRKIVAWRLGCEESAIQTRLAFADLFREWGIPHHALLDNSRAFWSKWITGGHRGHRFRFKVKAEEPVGLLKGVGVQMHAALPYHGQSKPIERAFRDLEDHIGKHPACQGAYTGNSPMAKPEDYGSRAVPWDEFSALVDAQIARHNARPGRRTETAQGRSFDDTFAESFATTRIKKAPEWALRFALLAAEQKKLNSLTGEIELHGNRYWHPVLSSMRGELVTVRFDPDDLHREVHVYDHAGEHVAEVPLLASTGFADAAGAAEAGKRVANHRKRAKELAEAEDLISIEALAELQAGGKTPEKPVAGVIEPTRPIPTPDAKTAPRPHIKPKTNPLKRLDLTVLKDAANNQ